jgi:hypothetical protein
MANTRGSDLRSWNSSVMSVVLKKTDPMESHVWAIAVGNQPEDPGEQRKKPGGYLQQKQHRITLAYKKGAVIAAPVCEPVD